MAAKNPDTTDTTTVPGYVICLWTTTGTGDWTIPVGVEDLEVLVVAAGGAGGVDVCWSGGGAGGLLYDNSFAVTPSGTVTVTVGAGAASSAGGNSVFSTMTANGGGYNGGAGGCGAGGRPIISGTGYNAGGAGSQGYDGGYVQDTRSDLDTMAGGGGGMGAVGSPKVNSNFGAGGNGGAGLEYSQFATWAGSPAGWFCGGGGGGYYGSSGGSGGGGSGSAGVANTGGGGGERYAAGGSGIVIVKYKAPVSGGVTAVALSEYGYMCEMMKQKVKKYWEGWSLKNGIFQPEMGVI